MAEIMNTAFDKNVARIAAAAEDKGYLVEYIEENYTWRLVLMGEKLGYPVEFELDFHEPRGYLVLRKGLVTWNDSTSALRSIPQVLDFL